MSKMRLGKYLVTAAASVVLAAETMQIAWTNDVNLNGASGVYGPDGPWQAIAVSVGNHTLRSDSRGNHWEGDYAAMWPSGSGLSMVLTSAAGGNYTMANSSTVKESGTLMSRPDDWSAWSAHNESSDGPAVYDLVTMWNKLSFEAAQATNTLVALD